MKKTIQSSLTLKAMQALTNAVAKVIEDHRSRGRPLALWRDGKAVWVPADQVGAFQESPPPYRIKLRPGGRAAGKAKV